MPRIVILDDHVAVAESFAEVLASVAGTTTLGIASTLKEARQLIELHKPDVVLADVHLGDGSLGLELLDFGPIKSGATRVLFVSGFDYATLVHAAERGHAAGYMLKSSPVGELANALKRVLAGDTVYDPKLLEARAKAIRLPSKREVELLNNLATGCTNSEAAFVLHISRRTVESHLRRLFRRYEVVSRSELLMLAIDQGWILPPQRN